MMNRNIKFLLVVLLTGFNLAFAQQKHESEAAVVRIHPGEGMVVGQSAKFKLEVSPKAGWHVYSAMPSEDGVYRPAELGWEMNSRGFEASEGLMEEGPMMSMQDDILGGLLRYYKTDVVFSQEVNITEEEVVFAGYFDYMACNEEKCIPLTAEFEIKSKAATK